MAETGKKPNVQVESSGGAKSMFSLLVILGSIAVGFLVYFFILGASGNFAPGTCEAGDCHPVEGGVGHALGLMYKGGFVVPIALGIFLMMLVFSIERFLTLSAAQGKTNIDSFVQKIQMHLDNGNIEAAISECDKQRGTVGNVIKELLNKYRAVEKETHMDKEQKLLALQKTLEEGVALELPMLSKHLVVIATIVSLGTLVGLIGTVLGMIKAFSALGSGGGSPDSAALAVGISEALINTALGITTSTIATISYNYFTSIIDGLTHKIDESGFSVIQTYAEKH